MQWFIQGKKSWRLEKMCREKKKRIIMWFGVGCWSIRLYPTVYSFSSHISNYTHPTQLLTDFYLFSVCTKFCSTLKVCISIDHHITIHPCFLWNFLCTFFFPFAGSLEHLRGLSTDTFSSLYTMSVIYLVYSYITCIYIFFVPIMVVYQDKFVESALWGANHPLQTGMRASSLFMLHNVQNNMFLCGGWCVTWLLEYQV